MTNQLTESGARDVFPFELRFEDVVGHLGKTASSSRSEFVRSDADIAGGADEAESPSGLISVSDGLDEQEAKLLDEALAARKGGGSSSGSSDEEEDNSESSGENSEATSSDPGSEEEEDPEEPAEEGEADADTAEQDMMRSRAIETPEGVQDDGEGEASGIGELLSRYFLVSPKRCVRVS